jgi:hypothetical protein
MGASMNEVKIEAFFLPSDEAWALAELVKRMGFSDCRVNAVDDAEAHKQMDALAKLQKALAESGFNPR